MDIQAEKYSLIEYITGIKDVHVIERIKQFLKANESDFWNELQESEKKEILKGITELDQGKGYDYEKSISKHR